MHLKQFLQKLLPGGKLEEIHDLEGWRVYYIRLMLLLGLAALPVGLVLSIPTYLFENAYGLIVFDLVIAGFVVSILFWGNKVPQIQLFFLLIYGMTITFLVTMGPYYARPAWLIMCVVSAGLLLGIRAAVITTVINAIVLIILYLYASPYLPAWQTPHQEPLAKWLMFCGNLSLLSLMSGIPTGFLLNRMNSLLTQEKHLSRQLTTESEDLHAINARLEEEIVERIKTAEENRRLQTELIQAQKMEAMGTLAGGIAHDFNNILSAIIGYGQLVQSDLSPSVRSKQNIEKLLNAGERARVLVQQILTFSRKVESSVEPLELAASVSDALKMIQALIPANVKLQQSLSGPCTVMSSSTFIHQILMNLCTNAIHAMGADGGMLDIELASVRLPKTEASSLKVPPGHYARISVRDTGCGIAPEIIDRIFEPYFTTKGMGSGTGLGLSVVHGIAQSQGGTIVCHSIPGQGTSFSVYLPQIDTQAIGEESLRERKIPTGTETILFVDDEAMLADTSGQILKTLGYQAVATTNSIEALKLFSDHPERFDAVITDMTMPNLTGDKLAKKILDIRPDMPIIICTGYSEYISNRGALQLGIRDFLMKPYTIDQLAQTLRRVLDGKTEVEEHRLTS